MVYTATLAAWADEDDTFRHVWQGERREFAGDSNLACTWQAKKVFAAGVVVLVGVLGVAADCLVVAPGVPVDFVFC